MKFINAFLLTVIINSIIVLLFTKAREVRLFAIPLFLSGQFSVNCSGKKLKLFAHQIFTYKF